MAALTTVTLGFALSVRRVLEEECLENWEEPLLAINFGGFEMVIGFGTRG